MNAKNRTGATPWNNNAKGRADHNKIHPRPARLIGGNGSFDD